MNVLNKRLVWKIRIQMMLAIVAIVTKDINIKFKKVTRPWMRIVVRDMFSNCSFNLKIYSQNEIVK